MEKHPLLVVLILFSITALIGLYLISRYLRRLPRQNWAMLLHGLFAAAGLGILFFLSAFKPSYEVPFASLTFFIIAIFSGLLMVMWDKIMNRRMPRIFPFFHAGAAITGLVLLILFIIKHNQPL